jgi:uncharacterized DUF497 family protein
MVFEWDERKSKLNLRKHRLRFETACLVFDDPHAVSQRDPAFDQEERWLTVGSIGPGAVILVVHTAFEKNEEEVIRIISARRADSQERKAYEDAHPISTARHSRHRSSKRRRD